MPRAATLHVGASVLAPIRTPLGTFTAHFTARGLARLDFPDRSKRSARRGKFSRQQTLWRALTADAVLKILSGKTPRGLPPCDLSGGSEFQQAVWRELRQVPRGVTRSYGEIAASIGRPHAMRAVGSACGANPIPLLIPCHRITRTNGPGGFSAGLAWKQRLLAVESRASPKMRSMHP
jgi:O-6-methylguanine DNA methyltransferase